MNYALLMQGRRLSQRFTITGMLNHYYAAVLIGCIMGFVRPSVCLSVPFPYELSKTVGHRKTKSWCERSPWHE